MIFSKFFKNKWQSKDSNTRITAINDELNADNIEHQQILIGFIKTDENELVRRAALIKLNDFDVWLNESQNNDNKKSKDFAQKNVLEFLTTPENVTLAQKNKILAISGNNSFLDVLLASENDAETIISLFKKINKPQSLFSVFSQKQIPQVQLYLVEQVEDVNTLEKLLKKACSSEVTQHINAKLETFKQQAELPKKLRKSVQLTLAKLLALKDVKAFDEFSEKREVLIADWQTSQVDFNCLENHEQETFIEKFNAIEQQLDKYIAPLAEQYKQDQIVENLKQQRISQAKQFDAELQSIGQELSTIVFENQIIDEANYQLKIKKLTENVQNSSLVEQQKSEYLLKINLQAEKLAQLPEIAESVTEATHLISKISQLAIPKNIDELNQRKPIYDDWLKQWKVTENKSVGMLPTSIIDAFKEIKQQWQLGTAQLIKEQAVLLNQTQKFIQDVKRLINSGKFNAAFGVYKKLNKSYSLLNEKQKLKLQRSYEDVSGEIENLSDWEHYIATPRKQKLIDEITVLVEQPIDNPNEQAKKVKQYRATWNSLGHADDDVDKDLNHQFNQLCEQAFVPCRLYYAEQEKLREQHLVTREKILSDVKHFADLFVMEQTSGTVNWKSIDAELNKFQQKWRDSGQVDRNLYQSLNKQYLEHLSVIKIALKAFHVQNGDMKKQLIAQATEQLDNENINQAIDNIKSLQIKWRNIGYSGPRDENKLWQDFRLVNDKVFAKREVAKKQEHENREQQESVFKQQLTEIESKLTNDMSIDELNVIRSEASSVLTEICSQRPVLRSCEQLANKILTGVEQKLEQAESLQKKKLWQDVFNSLSLVANFENSDEETLQFSLAELPSNWRKRINDCKSSTTQVNRSQKTLELEILAGVESPDDCKAERMQVQITLMQSQMLSNDKIDLTKSFIDWLKLGKLTADDSQFIDRLKVIYC